MILYITGVDLSLIESDHINLNVRRIGPGEERAMLKRIATMHLAGAALLVGLVFAAAAARAADNAVITGDSVRVRTQPSVFEDVRGTLNKGERVEVISRTDFTDTIDGVSAPWYGIVYGQYGGFVFGRYVTVDPGATVLPLPTTDIYGDRVSRFIVRGLHKFGRSEQDVAKTLGKPISRVHEKATGLITGISTLTYNGLIIGFWEVEDGKTIAYMVDCAARAYEFDTIKVGSTLWDVQRVLGPPPQPYAAGDETITYYDVSGFEWVTFTMRNETVIGITFTANMAD
jgi:hypothetical protein